MFEGRQNDCEILHEDYLANIWDVFVFTSMGMILN